jgi:hypothetical protein
MGPKVAILPEIHENGSVSSFDSALKLDFKNGKSQQRKPVFSEPSSVATNVAVSLTPS